MLGLIGKKVGMTQVFDDDGVLTPVTVIKIEPNLVVGEKTEDKCGYEAKVLAVGEVKPSKLTKPRLGQFGEDMTPKKKVMEFRDFDHECAVGDTLDLNLLSNYRYVDVIGSTKGKGYQGVMKRHGFGGGRKTHGSKFHRANGSTGMAASPSKVIKGTKMPGRMGNVRRTVQSLRLVRLDAEKQIILVKGSVPGTRNSFLIIRGAKKKY
jgi:large subunit ribosomal protein L3